MRTAVPQKTGGVCCHRSKNGPPHSVRAWWASEKAQKAWHAASHRGRLTNFSFSPPFFKLFSAMKYACNDSDAKNYRSREQ